MSEETHLVQAFMEEDKALVRADLLQRRVKGDTTPPSELIKSLSKSFPGVSKDLIRRLECDPSFVDDVLLEHEAALVGDMKAIFSVVVEKAKEGNEKFARLYFDLIKSRAPQRIAQTAPVQNILVTSKDPGEMYADFKRAARRMDTSRNSKSE